MLVYLEMYTKFLLEMPKGRDYLEDLDIVGRIILGCILHK